MKLQLGLAMELALLATVQAFLPAPVAPMNTQGPGFGLGMPFQPTHSHPPAAASSKSSGLNLHWGMLPDPDVMTLPQVVSHSESTSSAFSIADLPSIATAAASVASSSPLWNSAMSLSWTNGSSLLDFLVPTMLMVTAMGLTVTHGQGSTPESRAANLQAHYESSFCDLTIRKHHVPVRRFRQERREQVPPSPVAFGLPSVVPVTSPLFEVTSSYKPAFVAATSTVVAATAPTSASIIPLTVVPLDPVVKEQLAQPYIQTYTMPQAVSATEKEEPVLAEPLASSTSETKIKSPSSNLPSRVSATDVSKKPASHNKTTQSIILLAVRFLFNGFGDWTTQWSQLLPQAGPEAGSASSSSKFNLPEGSSPKATESIILKSLQASGRGLKRLGSRIQKRFRPRPV